MTGEDRVDRCAVHVLEMREIDPVFEYVLRVHLVPLLEEPLLRVVVRDRRAVTEAAEDIGRFEEGVAVFDVVPDVDRLIALDDGVGP